MVDLQFSCPLKWPTGKKATPPAERSQTAGAPSSLKIEEAIEYLRAELKDFPATSAILTSDYQAISDERLRSKIGHSSGASLILDCEGICFEMSCDKYHGIQLNIYALHLLLRHTLNMIKWGLGDVKTLLAGYRVNSDSMVTGKITLSGSEWWLQFLGLGGTAKVSDANAVYRSRAKDAGEDTDALLKLNEAISHARKHLS
jgi:hypothetical protein